MEQTNAQMQEKFECHILSTELPLIASEWDWRTPTTVWFSVYNGSSPDFVPRRYIWYEYNAETNVLTQLSESPYTSATITSGAQRSLAATIEEFPDFYYAAVSSPDTTRLIYPQGSPDTATYWLLDMTTNTQTDLGIRIFNVPTRVQWTADGNQFMITGIANSISPAYIVQIKGREVTLRSVFDVSIPLFENSREVLESAGHVPLGLSPDGRYVVVQPQLTPYLMWLIDRETNQFYTLPFASVGYELIWDSADKFLALTDLGIIEYTISTQSYTVIAAPDAGLYGTFSPDGRFTARFAYGEVGEEDNEFSVCRIR
jgi:hypothetical protein